MLMPSVQPKRLRHFDAAPCLWPRASSLFHLFFINIVCRLTHNSRLSTLQGEGDAESYSSLNIIGPVEHSAEVYALSIYFIESHTAQYQFLDMVSSDDRICKISLCEALMGDAVAIQCDLTLYDIVLKRVAEVVSDHWQRVARSDVHIHHIVFASIFRFGRWQAACFIVASPRLLR